MELTVREAQVAVLLASGLSYKGIAHRLGITVDTVNAHVQSAASRLPGDVSPKVKLILFVLDSPEVGGEVL